MEIYLEGFGPAKPAVFRRVIILSSDIIEKVDSLFVRSN